MYRNTYVEIDLKNINNNVKNLINKFNNYKYYFGVVKADCYGHYDAETGWYQSNHENQGKL